MQLSTLKLILIFLPIMFYKVLCTSPRGKRSDKVIFKQVRVLVACSVVWLLLFALLGIKPGAMCTPGKLSAIDQDLQNNFFFSYLFYDGFACIYLHAPCVCLKRPEECLELQVLGPYLGSPVTGVGTLNCLPISLTLPLCFLTPPCFP